MPSGIVRWFDPHDGRGDIEHLDHHYAVAGEDMQPATRHAGARVHFDVQRAGGIVTAVNVRPTFGTRTGRGHKRVGNLAGASRPDDKAGDALTHRAGDRGWRLSARPMEAARQWVLALAGPTVDAALPFYASDAIVHADGRTIAGRNRIRDFLYSHRLVGRGATLPEMRGDEATITLRWSKTPTRPERTARLRIQHGQIVEQWGPDEM